MRILYVEDNVPFRSLALREFLSEHEVVVASTLAEAHQYLAQGYYDAVLLDYDLPDGKGAELVEELALRGYLERLIAVSSRDENNAHLLAMGAFAAVSKRQFAGIGEVLSRL